MSVVVSSISPAGLAMEFVRDFAKEHEFFTSDEACDAYKAAGLPPPDGGKGWRDTWGSVMVRCCSAGYISKAGKAAPSSRSTHMASVVLWKSLLFPGERTAVEVGATQLQELRRRWVTREVTDLMTLLWHAYDVGFAQASAVAHHRPKSPLPISKGQKSGGKT